jgi:hypothetical protein
MTKGNPWTVEEENQLKILLENHKPIYEIAATLGRNPQAVTVKLQRLGLKVSNPLTTAQIVLPQDLPSVEETLKKLAGAMEAASQPGLSRIELQRLTILAKIASSYKDVLADYLNYREIESKLNDMEAKYAQLLKQTQSPTPQSTSAQMGNNPAAGQTVAGSSPGENTQTQ